MRNAAATFDDDFGDEPVRKKAPRNTRAAPRKAGGKSVGKAKKGGRLPFDMQRVARYAAVGMSATLALGIMVNALVLQKSRHPAPLFGKAIQLGAKPAAPAPTTPPAETATAAPAAAQPAEESEAPAERTADPAPVPAPAPKPRHSATHAATAHGSAHEAAGDPIARLLQGSKSSAAPAAEKPDTKTVLGTQRALAKLGFALKPNGTYGPATHKAIERFEKDHHLPVTGELSHKLAKLIESNAKADKKSTGAE